MSEFVILCERNLGFEAEYHERHFHGMPLVRFRVDHKAQRYGVLTTHEIKHAMCTMLNTVLREERLHMCEYFVSRDPKGMRRRLREQLEIYSYQFKSAASVFNKDALALSGKVGGMKDDVAIALQLVMNAPLQRRWCPRPRRAGARLSAGIGAGAGAAASPASS
eukprot:254068-Hanusia_phi.AAC.4